MTMMMMMMIITVVTIILVVTSLGIPKILNMETKQGMVSKKHFLCYFVP